MAAMWYIVLAVFLAYFSREVVSVTNEEFQSVVSELKESIQFPLDSKIEQDSIIAQLREENERQTREITHLKQHIATVTNDNGVHEKFENITIEERVSLLEIEMEEVQGEVVEVQDEVVILFSQQAIQDDRLGNLEEDTDQLEIDVEDVQLATLELEQRLNSLEENSNSSIGQLEVRVGALEATAADQESRLTVMESEVEGMQATDADLNARIAVLEETSDIFGFHAVRTSYDTIGVQTPIQFNEVILNDGNGYNSTTGVFTVPPGGDGVYYFSTYLLVDNGEFGRFDMRLNNNVVCTANGDQDYSGEDYSQGGCGAVLSVVEGDAVTVVLDGSTDNTPLQGSTSSFFNGFNGFRL